MEYFEIQAKNTGSNYNISNIVMKKSMCILFALFFYKLDFFVTKGKNKL